MAPHSRAPKKNTSHENKVLPQDTTHLIQRPCYQRGSPCQDLAGNWTTRRPPNDRKETQTAVVWSCLPFIRSHQTILHGTVKGRRRQGKQRKRWEDNIREWTGLEFSKSQRAVERSSKLYSYGNNTNPLTHFRNNTHLFSVISQNTVQFLNNFLAWCNRDCPKTLKKPQQNDKLTCIQNHK